MQLSLSAAALTLLLGACGTPPPAPASPAARSALTPPAEAPGAPAATLAQAAPAQAPERLNSPAPPPADVLGDLLRHADRMRQLAPNDMAAEIALQGDPGAAPLRQMQLAITLMHIPQPVDTARSLGLLQRVLSSPAAEAAPLKPLARLLAHRLTEQRRLEDAQERQAQQLRENQRRIEQLNERLEAMRAIERSLTTRPPAGVNGNRPATP